MNAKGPVCVFDGRIPDFIASRLRLALQTNDFSVWLANGLGLTRPAERANRIDIYANTVDSARRARRAPVEREPAPRPPGSTTTSRCSARRRSTSTFGRTSSSRRI